MKIRLAKTVFTHAFRRYVVYFNGASDPAQIWLPSNTLYYHVHTLVKAKWIRAQTSEL